MFVVKHASGGHTKVIAVNQAAVANAGHRHGGTGGAVISFITDGNAADGDRSGADVGSGTRLIGDGVVVFISTGISDVTEADGNVGIHMFLSEGTGNGTDAHVIPGNKARDAVVS